MLLERIWLSINALIAITASIYLVVFRALLQDAPGFALLTSSKGEVLIYGLCGLVLLFNLSCIVYALAMIDRKLVFRNDEGEITISLRAIESALSKAASSLPEMQSVRVKIRIPPSGRGPIRINALGTIADVADVRDLTHRIQVLIKMKLHEMLQIEGDLQFNVHFNKALHKPDKKEKMPTETKPQSAPQKSKKTGEEERPGNFPIKYPVDSDYS